MNTDNNWHSLEGLWLCQCYWKYLWRSLSLSDTRCWPACHPLILTLPEKKKKNPRQNLSKCVFLKWWLAALAAGGGAVLIGWCVLLQLLTWVPVRLRQSAPLDPGEQPGHSQRPRASSSGLWSPSARPTRSPSGRAALPYLEHNDKVISNHHLFFTLQLTIRQKNQIKITWSFVSSWLQCNVSQLKLLH